MKKILLILFFLFSLLSCKKDKKNENTGNNNLSNTTNVLNTNSHVVDATAVTGITDNSLTISKNNTLKPKIGDILISNPTATNPDGFLRKVISISETNSQYVCSTEPSNLNDAFEQLNIDTTYVNGDNSTQTLGAAKLKTLSSPSKYTINLKSNSSIAPSITLKGSLVFNVSSVQIKYTRKKGSLAPEMVLIKADFTTDGSNLEVTKSDNSTVELGEKILTTFDLPVLRLPVPVPTPVGVIIIQVPFSEKLTIQTLPVKISSKVKFTIRPVITASLGTKFENSNWTNLSTFTGSAGADALIKSNFTPDFSLNASLTLFTLQYSITPYAIDALKTYISIPNTVDLAVQPYTNPNYSLKYKLNITGGVKQEFYTGVKSDFSITNNLVTQTISEGNWTTTFPVLTTNPAGAITENSATCGGNITDSGGAAITAKGVCWSTNHNPTLNDNKTTDGTGSGVFNSNLTNLAANTTYYAKAYAINSLGTSFGNEISFTTANVAVKEMSISEPFIGIVYIGKQNQGFSFACKMKISKSLRFSGSIYPKVDGSVISDGTFNMLNQTEDASYYYYDVIQNVNGSSGTSKTFQIIIYDNNHKVIFESNTISAVAPNPILTKTL
jgi:hypothetical protein